MTEDWKKHQTNLLQIICSEYRKLLDGEVQYVTGCDKKMSGKKS